MPESRDQLLATEEVLELLGVSRSTFMAWRATGRAPLAFKLPNGSLRFRTSAVEEWLEGRVERENLEALRQARMR